MGAYFLLVEEQLTIRPTHGYIVCGDGTRHRIENTADLLAWVLDRAGQIRAAKAGGECAYPRRSQAGAVPLLRPAGELRAVPI